MSEVAKKSRRPPARTIEERQNELISAAYDLAEERIRNGTATSQELTHFLKLGSTRERLEQEKLRNENAMLAAKTDALRAEKDMGELYEKALAAFREYSGEGEYDEDF